MNLELAGKPMIVTGEAQGFGGAIAHGFAARGGDPGTCDVLDEERAEMAAQASGRRRRPMSPGRAAHGSGAGRAHVVELTIEIRSDPGNRRSRP